MWWEIFVLMNGNRKMQTSALIRGVWNLDTLDLDSIESRLSTVRIIDSGKYRISSKVSQVWLHRQVCTGGGGGAACWGNFQWFVATFIINSQRNTLGLYIIKANWPIIFTNNGLHNIYTAQVEIINFLISLFCLPSAPSPPDWVLPSTSPVCPVHLSAAPVPRNQHNNPPLQYSVQMVTITSLQSAVSTTQHCYR